MKEKKILDHVGEVLPPASSKGLKNIPGTPTAQLAAGIKDLVVAWKEYKVTVEIEKTNRTRIKAWEITQVKKLEAQRDLVKEYFSRVFPERREIVQQAFERLDKSLMEIDRNPDGKSGMAGVDASLKIIVAQMQTSPLMGLNDLMRTMEDGSGTINI
jgi:hypothetical protein